MVLNSFLTDVDLMPYASVNAHNLWWLLAPWESADRGLIGPLTPKILGLSLFGAVYLVVLWAMWRKERGDAATPARSSAPGAHWFLAAAVIAFAFFTLSTHMHENHLFPALPFLILVAGRGRRWAWLMGIAGFCMLVNMANHDLLLGEMFLATAGGASGFFHPDFGRPLSRVEYIVANINAGLTVATFGMLLLAFIRTARRPGERR